MIDGLVVIFSGAIELLARMKTGDRKVKAICSPSKSASFEFSKIYRIFIFAICNTSLQIVSLILRDAT